MGREEVELTADKEEVKAPAPKLTRKISLTRGRTSTDKQDEGDKENQSTGETSTTEKPARKRKWGSKTATIKPPRKATSIAISTDSLKGLIPDIKTNIRLDVPGIENKQPEEEEEDTAPSSDKEDKRDVKIRRTVLQVVRKEADSGLEETEDKELAVSDKGDDSDSTSDSEDESEKEEEEEEEEGETEQKVTVKKEVKTEVKQKVEPKIVRRLNHQAVLMEVDEPQATGRSGSPARHPVSKIIHIRNLVRPFTVNQLKELLRRTGTLVEENFWIDKVKSRCYAAYSTEEEATATREALHGTKWPQSNPKILTVDYATQSEIDFQKEKEGPPPAVKKLKEKEREKEIERRRKAREERQKAREEELNKDRERRRREEAAKPPPIREWDRDKIQQRSRSPEIVRNRRRSGRSRSRERRDRSRERADRREKKEKKGDEPPAKLLDDLFRKTKTTPCIYWLPLTEEQIKAKTDRIHFPIRIAEENPSIIERDRLRAERDKEREMRIRERQERDEGRRGRPSPPRGMRDRDRGIRDRAREQKMSEESPDKMRSRRSDSRGRQRADRSGSRGRRR